MMIIMLSLFIVLLIASGGGAYYFMLQNSIIHQLDKQTWISDNPPIEIFFSIDQQNNKMSIKIGGIDGFGGTVEYSLPNPKVLIYESGKTKFEYELQNDNRIKITETGNKISYLKKKG